MAGARFGDCKCGFPADHKITAGLGGQPKAGGLKKTWSPAASARGPQVGLQAEEQDGSGACDNYRVDMAAARFGDCKCGQG